MNSFNQFVKELKSMEGLERFNWYVLKPIALIICILVRKFGKNTIYYFLKLKTRFLPICRREILLSGEILKVDLMDV